MPRKKDLVTGSIVLPPRIEDIPLPKNRALAYLDISVTLAVKLASLVQHIEEYKAKKGHPFDITAAQSIVDDVEVQRWMKKFPDVLLPRKR